MSGKKWAISSNEEDWQICDVATKEEAVDCAPDDLSIEPGEPFWVGAAEYMPVPQIDVDRLLEEMDENAFEWRPDGDDPWPDATQPMREELKQVLNAAFFAWVTKHKLEPRFFTVEGETKHVAPEPERDVLLRTEILTGGGFVRTERLAGADSIDAGAFTQVFIDGLVRDDALGSLADWEKQHAAKVQEWRAPKSAEPKDGAS